MMEAFPPAHRAVADFLIALGYTPVKQRVAHVTFSFKHKKSGHVIAKMSLRKDGPSIALKFFGAGEVPERYRDALLREIDVRKGQYSGAVRHPDRKVYCGYCPACTGGGLGYHCVRADGTEVLRCGAYPIPIPGFSEADVPEALQVLLAQHEYFMSM